MYFRIKQQERILNVDDAFAHLRRVHADGSLEFVFFYAVSQARVIQRRATRVAVTLESRSISKKPMMGQTQRGMVDSRALVRNVRSAVIDAKTAAEQQSRYVVARRESDVTAYINNEVVPQLRSHVPISRIPAMTRSRLVMTNAGSIKQDNDPRPLLHRLSNSFIITDVQHALSASVRVDPQAIMHDMIVRQGIDPAHVFNLTSRASSEVATRGGLSNTQHADERATDPATQLLNCYLFPPTMGQIPSTSDAVADTDFVQVVRSQTSDEITVPVVVVVAPRRLRVDGAAVTQLYVTFELLEGATNLPVDSVTKVLDVSKHLRVHNTPKQAPRVGFASSGAGGRVNLEIKQVDLGASEVQVYKKSFWTSTPETDVYTLIGTYPLTARDQSLLVQVDQPRSSPVLYRVIPVGQQSVQGFEYTNVAVSPARSGPIRSASLTAQHTDVGSRLEVRKIPPNVVAMHFLRWNLTTHDTVPTLVGSDVGFVDDSVRRADLLSLVDGVVVPNNVYRYRVRLIYRDGSTSECGDATVDFIQPAPGQVDTRIDDLQVDHDVFPNVTFTISTRTIDSDIDVVKRMLERQGLVDYFTGDITNQRDQLQELIAHNVQRVDLLTGRREDFGVLTDPQFDDAALRKRHAVSVLRYGHRYRYEVYPLLRAPETLFDSLVTTKTDVVTKKPYAFRPAKFLHPFTQKRGVIVSTLGARLRHAKDPMAYGVIGSIATTEVSFDNDTARVVDQAAAAFDRYTNLVTWNVSGQLAHVDHFVVMKQVHGIRTLLGKSHSSFVHGGCQYVHVITSNDVGALQYVILPVYGDYRLGHEAVTNTLIVEVE